MDLTRALCCEALFYGVRNADAAQWCAELLDCPKLQLCVHTAVCCASPRNFHKKLLPRLAEKIHVFTMEAGGFHNICSWHESNCAHQDLQEVLEVPGTDMREPKCRIGAFTLLSAPFKGHPSGLGQGAAERRVPQCFAEPGVSTFEESVVSVLFRTQLSMQPIQCKAELLHRFRCIRTTFEVQRRL